MKIQTGINKQLQEELATRLEKVKWHGEYFSCLCIFHDNTDTPAMMVYPDSYNCKGCGVWGTLDNLQKKLSGVKIRYKEGEEEINERPPWLEWKKKYGSYEHASLIANKNANDYLCLLHYLKDRKLPAQAMVMSGYVGYLDGWLSFPVINIEGLVVDWVVRSTPAIETNIKYATRPRKNKNEGFHLYTADWNRITQCNEVYIPFGILDMWTLYYCGLASATGMTGKAYKTEWFDDIRKNIILVPDYGEEEDALRFAKKLGWRATVKVLDYPHDTKDVTDILTKYGLDAVKELIGVQ